MENLENSFFGKDQILSVNLLIELLRDAKDGIEVMCHPGYVDEYLRTHSSYAIPRKHELDILCSKELKKYLTTVPIQLMNRVGVIKEIL